MVGTLARNTLWMTFGQGLRIAIQFLYFVLIARLLNAEGYGAFAGVVALVSILVPFSGWGGGSLLVKNVAREPASFPVYWGRGLVMVAASAAVMMAVVLVVGRLILPASVPLTVILWVAISDLFFARLMDLGAQAFQAFQRLFQTALLGALLAASRLAAAWVLMKLTIHDALEAWGLLYLAGTALIGTASVLWVSWEHGRPRWHFSGWRSEFREGFYFAGSISAQRIYLDSDKALLTRLAALETAGIYSAAARVIDVVFVPVAAFLNAAYPRFFVQGSSGLRGSLALAKRLIAPAAIYAVAAGTGIYLLAPIIPWLLGSQYSETAVVVRWLAVLPFLMTLRYFAAHSLTGAGKQGLRTVCEGGIACFNVAANLVLIPRYGWEGSAIAILASECLLMGILWIAAGALCAGDKSIAENTP